ncbi:hypothetical protein FOA52_000084 [Chlamydomonas sp. UWO 241]|nr:hypothetical protein FOA52_000084 [Chlamydomonas sp. UWO 241]
MADDPFEDAEEELGFDDWDALVNLPEALEAFYEGEEVEAERQQSGVPAEDASAKREASPLSHALHEDAIDQTMDQFDYGDFNFDLKFDLKLRSTFRALWRPQHILLMDKLSFLLGCTMLWGCAFWLGHAPQSFYKLYTPLAAILIVVRYVTYKKKKLHYYLLGAAANGVCVCVCVHVCV